MKTDFRNDTLTLEEIHKALNGVEWDSDTIERVAFLLEAAGFYIAEVNEASSPDRETTPGHGDCACRACAH
jgi:hypothetical protein